MAVPDNTRSDRLDGDALHAAAPSNFDALQSVLRFVVGGVLEGTDEALRRLKAEEARLRASDVLSPTVEHAETEADRARYAVVGMLFEGAEALREGLGRWEHSVALAGHLASQVAEPLKHHRMVRPWQRRYDAWAERGATIVERWVQKGRVEDLHSRALMLRTSTQAIDDIFDVLGENEGVQAIIQQQSVGMTTMMVGEARERAATADGFLERIAHRLLRRPPCAATSAAEPGDPTAVG